MDRLFSCIIYLLVLLQEVKNNKVCQSAECLYAAKHLTESMNWSIKPCNNFYHYACGNFPNHHPNLDNITQSQFRVRYEENSAEILEFLRQNNSKHEPEAVHKARKLFSICTNEDSFSNTLEPIKAILQEIGIALLPFIPEDNRTADYTTLLARTSRLTGIKVHFDLGTDLNPYNRTRNIIALVKPSSASITKTKYTPNGIIRSLTPRRKRKLNESIGASEFLVQISDKLCENDNSSSCLKWTSYAPRLKKSFGNMVIESRDDSHQNLWPVSTRINSTCDTPAIYTLKQVQDLTDATAAELNPSELKLNWTRYIEEIFTDINNVTINLTDPTKVEIFVDDFDSFNKTLRHINRVKPLHKLEAEIWWALVSTLVPYIDLDMFDAKNKVVNSKRIQTREERCSMITSIKLNLAVSYMYTKKYTTQKYKHEIHWMIENIRESLKNTIWKTSWLDKETRLHILKKLQWIYYYIMYPDIVTNSNRLDNMYRNINITDNLFESIMSIQKDQIVKELGALNQENYLHDERDFLSSTAINAYYETTKNYIMIAGGIVGGLAFTNSLKAIDYGALGSIIGHELHHAFDLLGRCHDFLGNYKDWWKAETWNLFKEKAQCFVEVYNSYNTTLNGITQQGDSEMTLSEDISDNGGFKASLFAYRTLVSKHGSEPLLPQFENFTHEQLFTLAFANMWCENPSVTQNKQTRRLALHSPKGVRVNGVLRNSKEFSEIWNCTKGSNMNPNDDKCTVW